MLEPTNPASSPAELFRQLASTAQQIELPWSPSRAQGILRGVERQRRQAARRRAMVPMLCAASLAIVLASVASWAAFRQPSSNWTWPWSSVRSTVIPQVSIEHQTLRSRRSEATAPAAPTPPVETAPAPTAAPAPELASSIAPAVTPAIEDHTDSAVQVPVVHGVVKPIVRTRLADRTHLAPIAPAAQPAPSPTTNGGADQKPTWQQLAHEGQFEQAYTVAYGPPESPSHVTVAPVAAPAPSLGAGDLLLLADVARLSHHPADAVSPLNRLLANHAADPRAPLAAFTLGRVLLDDLGRPREAADAFRRVQTLELQGPDGPLAQDALAREVEAWSRAGEPQRAREPAPGIRPPLPDGAALAIGEALRRA